MLERGDIYLDTRRLVGEYFAARGKRPRALTLSVDHAPKNLKSLLHSFGYLDSSTLNSPRPKVKDRIDVVTVAHRAILENTDFGKWLEEELIWRTPVSVSHIVSTSDKESIELGERCAEILRRFRSGVDWKVIPQGDVSKLKEQNPTGVLVASVLIGNGGIFREIARDLREFCPLASRHFLAGLGLPDTTDSWNRLVQFLERSISHRKYVFSAWALLPVGIRHPSDCWSKYGKLHEALDVLDPQEFEYWSGTGLVLDSLDLAKQALAHSGTGFLGTVSGEQLKLTEGFVYWSPETKLISSATQAGTFLAMSAVLQTAREFPDSTRRLKSSLHETVVLDPENFLRFNDGVIQSAILRSAHPFELDYTSSPELSESMRTYLEKVFINSRQKYGEASLEFAAALASGQTRVNLKDAKLLLENVLPRLIALKSPTALLGFLFAFHRKVQD